MSTLKFKIISDEKQITNNGKVYSYFDIKKIETINECPDCTYYESALLKIKTVYCDKCIELSNKKAT
ncbi:MAG: hypothetical protein CVU01_02715 [Bacteroidetes bacterium HGW-Bacteroidetes-18]|nr:MAG: hypothetical protein CVU01_02715 [Bacteroidetes bacterium HGW-Bacteroidetes-18]